MAGLCLSCGAPLGVPVRGVITCSYCGRTVVVEGPRRHVPPPEPPRRDSEGTPAKPGNALVYVLSSAVTGLVLIGTSVAAFVQSEAATRSARDLASGPSALEGPARATTMPVVPPRATMEPTRVPTSATPRPPEPASAPKTPSTREPTRAKTQPPPEPAGEVVSKAEAEQRLTPRILACMREANVHYLITRLGSGSKTRNPLPPLEFTETMWVDYREVQAKTFGTTPLGRCIAKAAKSVRAATFGGNYIYFGLRNPAAPDPLADAPERFDHEAAERKLAERNAQARACDARDPAHAPMGESVPIILNVNGFDGKVTHVDMVYVNPRSTYAKCIKSVYAGMTLSRFRGLEQKVTYHIPAP